jgi:hypothetical protein
MIERDEKLEEHHRGGRCYPMAVALARLNGWRAGAILVEVPGCTRSMPWRTHVVHAFAIDHEGNFVDAGGPITEEDLRYEFITLYSHRRMANERIETFDDAAGLEGMLAVNFGLEEWSAYAVDHFDPAVAEATEVARQYVMPRWYGQTGNPSPARPSPMSI